MWFGLHQSDRIGHDLKACSGPVRIYSIGQLVGAVLIGVRGHFEAYDTQTYLLRFFLSQAKPYILPGILVMYARQSFQPRQ